MRKLVLLALCCLAAAAAQARLVEDVLQVPVTVSDIYGKPVTHAITVTVFSDDSNPRPAPVLVINHGRAFDAKGRADLGRARFSEASRFFVGYGFIVAVPTRIGYGATGGGDVEDPGPCTRRMYPPAFAAVAQQALAALAAVRRRPDAAPDRALLVGHSFGGAGTVALAAMNPPGVQAAINFAGGSGGNPKDSPQRPCASPLMERTLADYGRSARVPMLWLYAENDQFFGPDYARLWHAAFTGTGGKADLVIYPPHGEDGHALFNRFHQAWKPRVAEFLKSHGYVERPEAAPSQGGAK